VYRLVKYSLGNLYIVFTRNIVEYKKLKIKRRFKNDDVWIWPRRFGLGRPVAWCRVLGCNYQFNHLADGAHKQAGILDA
jgi:hypothetical protein